MAEIEMRAVKSSYIEAVGYDKASRTLRVRFPGGKEFDYANVGPEKHAGLLDAKSIGSYFHSAIRNRFRSQPAKKEKR